MTSTSDAIRKLDYSTIEARRSVMLTCVIPMLKVASHVVFNSQRRIGNIDECLSFDQGIQALEQWASGDDSIDLKSALKPALDIDFHEIKGFPGGRDCASAISSAYQIASKGLGWDVAEEAAEAVSYSVAAIEIASKPPMAKP